MDIESIHARIGQAMRQHEHELIDLHRALVRIPTVNAGDGSSAEETRAASLARDYLAGSSIAADILEPVPGRGNLLAETGSGDGASILLLSHSDVVPAGEDSAWKFPPFAAEMAKGRIWGRGAYDCKMLAASHLFVMATLAREGLPRRGILRLVMTADEEAGGSFGSVWLARARPDFLHCDLAVCEGGGASLGRWGGNQVFTIGTGEKGRCEAKVTFRAPGGHAGTPWGRRNPLYEAAAFLTRLQQMPVDVSAASPVFESVGQWLSVAEGVTPRNLESIIERIDQLSPSYARSLRAQSRMSFAPTVLHGGKKSNALPDEVVVICDFRLLPGDAEQCIERVLNECLNGLEGVEIQIEQTAEASSSTVTPDLRSRFEAAASRAAGTRMQAVPVWCSGFTDARVVRRVHTQAFGFQFVHPAADPERLGIHCIDESIEAAMLLPCAQAVAHFVLDTLC